MSCSTEEKRASLRALIPLAVVAVAVAFAVAVVVVTYNLICS